MLKPKTHRHPNKKKVSQPSNFIIPRNHTQKTQPTRSSTNQLTQYRPSPLASFYQELNNQPITGRTPQKKHKTSNSPFSSAKKSEKSPRFKQYISPPKRPSLTKKISQKPKQKKKAKCASKRQEKPKDELKNSPQMAYQRYLVQRMSQKRITEMSQQESSQLFKNRQLIQRVAIHKKIKKGLLELRRKIQIKYRQQLGSFNQRQFHFYCSVVLIQRWWRGKKAKEMIRSYINSQPKRQRLDQSTLPVTPNITLPRLQIKKTPSGTNITQGLVINKNKEIQKHEQKEKSSQEINILQLSEIMQETMLSDKSLQNCQGMTELSLSYQKLFNKKAIKSLPLKFQSTLSQDSVRHHLYYYLQKNQFNQIKSQIVTPKKIISDKIEDLISPPKLNFSPISPLVQLNKQIQQIQNKQKSKNEKDLHQKLNTLSDLSALSQLVIRTLFIQTAADCLTLIPAVSKKNKNPIVPGIIFTISHIHHYLSCLAAHIISVQGLQILDTLISSNALHFFNLIRLNRQSKSQETLQVPLVSNQILQNFEAQYEKNFLYVGQQNQKYSSFLGGLFNLNIFMLSNCLIEQLENVKLNSIPRPWDQHYPPNIQSQQILQKQIESSVNKIVNVAANTNIQKQNRVSIWINKNDRKLVDQDQRCDQVYKTYFQLRLQLSDAIQQLLFSESTYDFL